MFVLFVFYQKKMNEKENFLSFDSELTHKQHGVDTAEPRKLAVSLRQRDEQARRARRGSKLLLHY